MIATLRRQISIMEAGLRAGIGLGLGLIFLTLIGIPSDDSEQLAALAVPLYLLITFGVGWRLARKENAANIVMANAISLGSSAAIIFLVFLGQINHWHAEGLNVTADYFDKMNTYPMHILSGVPEEELFAQPALDPITQTYPPDTQLRTNPMRLSFGTENAVVSVGSLGLGGLYGLGISVLMSSLLGSLTPYAVRRFDWKSLLRQQSKSAPGAGGLAEHWPSIQRWALFLAPLGIFAIFWMTIPQEVGGDTPLQVIDLNEVLNLSSDSLLDEAGLQLALSFALIVMTVINIRAATPQPANEGASYIVRAIIAGGSVLGIGGLAMWRIVAHDVRFVDPSFDLSLGGQVLDAQNLSIVLAVLVIGALLAYGLRATRRGGQFEVVYTTLISISLVLAMPLYMNQYQTSVLGLIMIFSMLGLGLNIVIGYAGLLDLGYVAFYAVGAYTLAFLATQSTRAKVDTAHLNDIGWATLVGFIVAPVLIFALTNLWHMRPKSSPDKAQEETRLQKQSRVWDDAPPPGITILLVSVAISVVFVVWAVLSASGIIPDGPVSPFLVAIVLAWLAAAFVGFALGVPVLRLRGDYLAIVTLGFGEIFSLALRNLEGITGGPSGAVSIPKPLPETTSIAVANLTMLYLSFVGAGLVIFIAARLRDSRLGRAWLAMRSDEDIAQAMGINLVNVKLLAFTIGSSFAGLSGILLASRQGSVFPENFELQISINVLALVIIGGMGSIPGVFIGAIALIGLPELLRPIQGYRIMAFGLLLILSMVTLPNGLMPAPPPQLEEKAKRLAERRKTLAKQNSAADRPPPSANDGPTTDGDSV